MRGRVGDLSQYDSLDNLVSFYEVINAARPKYYAKQLWQFAHSIKEGDILVAYKLFGILDIGIVNGPVVFEWDNLAKNNEMFCYRRPVQWLGLDYKKLTTESARRYMSRNMTLFMVSEESSLLQIQDMLQESSKKGELDEDSLGLLDDSPIAADIEEPPRTKTTTYRILRDTAKSRKVKKIHKHRCQICGKRILVPGRGPYSEVHHIRPLGGSHKGLDKTTNMLCLCPMHHAEMDLGVLYIDPSSLRVIHSNERNRHHSSVLRLDKVHRIGIKNLIYHKQVICSDWMS
jgi:hypothetical protein